MIQCSIQQNEAHGNTLFGKSGKAAQADRKGDKKTAGRILAALEAVAGNPKGAHDIKVLKGKLAVFKRLRVGNYRVLFDEDGNVLTVYEVKHRQEAYHD